MDHVAKLLDDAIDAVYASEWGVDENAHIALVELVHGFTAAVHGKDEADRKVRDLNMRVDATDGCFYYGG